MWLGHDHGIMRLTPPDEPLVLPEATDEDVVDTVDPLQGTSIMSVRLGGPVLTMNPLVLGRCVAYATAHDGFGMVVERVGERPYEIERQPAP